ncbi:MAG: GNAT family N-acetyltransferase [Hyphomicrobiales bacterium]|nr:GNAT family N-acetyltransferase [Hyphomicrobiales bacterium]
MSVVVREVNAVKDFTRFIDVPHLVYRGDPDWVPPLRDEARKMFDRAKNPFFKHAEGAFWIAERDGRPVGRICASVNRLHLDLHKDGQGNFGALEAIDDPDVFASLLKTAEDWLRARGLAKAVGPYTVSVNDEIGVLIEGFGAKPSLMMAHSPRHYAPRLEAAGYGKAMDLLAFRCPIGPRTDAFAERIGKVRARMRGGERLTVRTLDRKRFAQEIRLALDIYNDAWRGNWGFVPVTAEEAVALTHALKPILDPRGVVFGLVDGVERGVLIGVPNLNELIADLDGRLFPTGLVKLLWRLWRRPPKTARVMLAGVREEWRGTALGSALPPMMVSKVLERGKELGIREVELSWVLEDNAPAIAICSAVGDVAKRYRIYETAL